MRSLWKFIKILVLAIALWVSIIILIYLLRPSDANAAESDSLYFTSATDMMAKVDSIEAVCDTVETHMWIQKQYTDSTFLAWELEKFLEHEWIDREYGLLRYKIAVSTITCRELIRVGVIARPDSVRYEWQTTYPAQYRKIRGQMVVWWREVVQ